MRRRFFKSFFSKKSENDYKKNISINDEEAESILDFTGNSLETDKKLHTIPNKSISFVSRFFQWFRSMSLSFCVPSPK